MQDGYIERLIADDDDLYLHLDFETCHVLDLRKVGAFKYARTPGLVPYIMAYGFGKDGPIAIWTPDMPFPQEVMDHMLAKKPVVCWSAQFERLLFMFVVVAQFWPQWERDAWNETNHKYVFIDAMAIAAYFGFPLALAHAGPALKLSVTKDMAGNRLIKRMALPRRMENGRPVWWHETDPEKYAQAISYCRDDVETERRFFYKLGRHLPDQETELWELDFKMNMLGVNLDPLLVARMSDRVAEETARLDSEIQRVSNGELTSTRQTKKITEWVQSHGLPYVENLRKDTLEDWSDTAPPTHRVIPAGHVLLIRKEAAKSSTAKLTAMMNCADEQDYVMRGLVQYYGALRTGRYAGRLAQPHNYPRPVHGLDQEAAIKAILEPSYSNRDLETTFDETPLDVISSSLRGCFVPPEKQFFYAGDFSQIEARVAAWLAGQKDKLDAFARGEDVYTMAAKKIGSDSRQLGKALELACGFCMGGPKFQDTARKAPYKIKMDVQEATAAVYAWRETNPEVVQAWTDIERAFTRLVSAAPGTVSGIFRNRVVLTRHKHCISITLPSGRELFYWHPKVIVDPDTGWTNLVYRGWDSFRHRWGTIHTYGGKLFENVVQAVARDVLAEKMLELNKRGYQLRLTVHDEILSVASMYAGLRQSPEKHLDRLLNVMRAPLEWTDGLPIEVEGWHGPRFGKF